MENQRTKWVVKRQTDGGLVVISEHNTEKDARAFWRGVGRTGEREFIYEEIKIEG